MLGSYTRNPFLVWGPSPEFVYNRVNRNTIALPAVLQLLYSCDETRRKVLVEVYPHAASASSKSRTSLTCCSVRSKSSAKSDSVSPARSRRAIASVVTLVPSITGCPNACRGSTTMLLSRPAGNNLAASLEALSHSIFSQKG